MNIIIDEVDLDLPCGVWCKSRSTSSIIINRYNVDFSNILQTGHITLSSTPDLQLENHSTKYHR